MAAPGAFVTFIILHHLLLSVPRACAEDVTTTIDDSDPGIRHVVGKWVHFKGGGYYNRTETLTKDAGATSQYTFNGTQIAVFGTQCDPPGGNTTVSTYTVDGLTPSKYTVPPGVVCNQNFVNFYTSPPLQNGPHTLVIKNLNNNSWYFLDYLTVTAPKEDDVTKTSSSSPSATSAGSTSLSKSSSISTGAIAGIAVSIAVLLVLIIIAALLWKRRRRESHFDRRPEEGLMPGNRDASPPAVVTPYLVSSDTAAQNSTKYGFGYNGVSGYSQNMAMAAANGSNGTAATSSVVSPSRMQTQAEMFQVQGPVAAPADHSDRHSITTTIPPPYVK